MFAHGGSILEIYPSALEFWLTDPKYLQVELDNR